MVNIDTILFIIFLLSMITCMVVCLILFKYQSTISPANQSIINKLSIFLVFCAAVVNTTQVG